MSDHIVRLATVDDLTKLREISSWAIHHTPANFATHADSLETWTEQFTQCSSIYPWIVAESGRSDILGYAKAASWKPRAAYAWTCELSVYVRNDVFGRGIATSLYRQLVPTLVAQGYRTLFAGITLPNTASVRLHESIGMTRCATMQRSGWKFNTWHDVGYWEMHVGDGPPHPIRSVIDVWDG